MYSRTLPTPIGNNLRASRSTLLDLAGVGFQLALDHLAGHVLDQPTMAFSSCVLLGQRREQAAHQAFQAGHLGTQGHFSFLADLELVL
jgi:hypothetical protein